jgi:hypothetical protein
MGGSLIRNPYYKALRPPLFKHWSDIIHSSSTGVFNELRLQEV